MAETTADVRRDIEMTRERMSSTLAELEQRLNVMELVKQHPWPAVALAAGAGFALAGTGVDTKAAAATVSAAHATSQRASRLGPGLDDVIARLLGGVQEVLLQRADELVHELRTAIGVSGPREQQGASSQGASSQGAGGWQSSGASGAQGAYGAIGASSGAGSMGTSGGASGGASGGGSRGGARGGGG